MFRFSRILPILLTLLLAACGHTSHQGEINHVAALVDSGQRRQALDAIDSIDVDDLDECDKAHIHFLKATALDEYNDMDEAVTLLRRSLREALSCGHDSIAHKANLYLAYLNNISGNHSLAINHALAALDIADAHGNPRWSGAAYLQLSGSYHARGMMDSSRYYIDRLIPLLPYQSRHDLPDMLNNIAVSRLEADDVEGARRYLDRSLKIAQNEHTYYLMAVSYQQQGRNDSAELMWKKALSGSDPYLQSRISQSYAEWSRGIGEYERASAALYRAQQLKDSLDSRGLGETAMKAHSDSERQDIEEAGRRRMILWIGICVLLVAVVIALWWHLRLRARRARSLSQSTQILSSQKAELEQQMEQLRTEIDVLKGQCDRHNQDAQELEKMVREKSRQLRALEQKHASNEKEMKAMSTQMHRMESHHDKVMDIGQRRHAEIMDGGRATQWSKNDMQLFADYYYLMHPDFAISVKEEYTTLSPTLALIVILTEMGFDQERIRDILGMSSGAWRTARSRINASRLTPPA